MPRLSDIISAIEQLAPPALAEDWDNSGLQIGEPGSEIGKLLVALDPLPEVIDEAVRTGASLVVSHHPLFFGAVRSLDTSSGIGAAVKSAIRGGVAVYSAHTSLDSVSPGVSDALAAVLKLKDTRPVVQAAGQKTGSGLGRIGALPRPMKVSEVAAAFKETLGLTRVRLTGAPERSVRRVAVCGGSGSELIGDAVGLGAEVFVTGDVKYHAALMAAALGIAVLDVGHYESEKYALPAFAARLKQAIRMKGWKVAVELSTAQGAPWTTL
jgi:dinuclear metal center YbgI/SA1388 family protein